MKTKVFKLQDGKRNEDYIEEIKELMRRNENADTVADFDESGNYVVKVFIPDWRDKFKKDSLEAIKRKQIEEGTRSHTRTYGDYKSAKRYQPKTRYNNNWGR